MKNCPKCSRIYSDETLSFCLDDGSLLKNFSEAQTEFFEEPTIVRSANTNKNKTAIGLKSNIASGICYLPLCGLAQLLALFFSFTERKNSFVKFHAIQSLLLSISALLFWLLEYAVLDYLVRKKLLFGISDSEGLGQLTFIIICIFMLLFSITAFRGEKVSIPIIGRIALYLSSSQSE